MHGKAAIDRAGNTMGTHLAVIDLDIDYLGDNRVFGSTSSVRFWPLMLSVIIVSS